MSFIITTLTFILILNCLLLILLVLVQLPKKDAGAGMAFGAGTADALFGSGSGNVLTKVTKYATAIFLVLALILGYLQDSAHRSRVASADFSKQVDQQKAPAQAPKPAAAPAPATPGGNLLPTQPAAAPAGTNASK